MVSAGRILILPQGTWDNATMYNMLDLVAYNGISWLCKRQCVGITPSVTATEYWQQFGSSAPIASTTVAGLVMPDGQTITINTTTGAIAVPTATAAGLGLVKPDGTSITIDANGVISSAGGNLSNLGDVAITSLQTGQVLIWNQTNQKWQNGTIAGALSQLSDVLISSESDGQILVYDNTAGKWKNATAESTLSSSTKPIQTKVVKDMASDVIETLSAGASQAYSAGDLIMCSNGKWYKAITDISQNQTLTAGGNVEETSQRALNTNLTQQLTADNGQEFKYGYDSTSQKYGYYVAGSGGADTFVPFSTGGSATIADWIAQNSLIYLLNHENDLVDYSDRDFIKANAEEALTCLGWSSGSNYGYAVVGKTRTAVEGKTGTSQFYAIRQYTTPSGNVLYVGEMYASVTVYQINITSNGVTKAILANLQNVMARYNDDPNSIILAIAEAYFY